MPRKSPYTTAARCLLFQYMDQYTLWQLSRYEIWCFYHNVNDSPEFGEKNWLLIPFMFLKKKDKGGWKCPEKSLYATPAHFLFYY